MRKCRNGNLRAQLVVAKAVKTLSDYLAMRRHQILLRLRTRWALAVVVNTAVRFMRKRRHWEANRLRYALLYTASTKYMQGGSQKRSGIILKDFLSNTAEVWNLKKSLENFYRVCNRVKK